MNLIFSHPSRSNNPCHSQIMEFHAVAHQLIGTALTSDVVMHDEAKAYSLDLGMRV